MRAASHHAFRVTARLSKLLFKPSLYLREYCLFSGYNREIAKENDVVVVENKPLAQALFKNAEVGDAIPPDLYKAVAEVLAYVYRLKRKYS